MAATALLSLLDPFKVLKVVVPMYLCSCVWRAAKVGLGFGKLLPHALLLQVTMNTLLLAADDSKNKTR